MLPPLYQFLNHDWFDVVTANPGKMNRGYNDEEWRLVEDSDTLNLAEELQEDLNRQQPEGVSEKPVGFGQGFETKPSKNSKELGMGTDADVLAELGVKSVAESDITRRVIQDAERTRDGDKSTGQHVGDTNEDGEELSETDLEKRRISEKLSVLKKEIAAVSAGLEEEAAEAGPDESGRFDTGVQESGAERVPASQDVQSVVSLQRALASRRLTDLKSQRRQLREQLGALEDSDKSDIPQVSERQEEVNQEDTHGGPDQTAKRVRETDVGGSKLGQKKGGTEDRATKRVRFNEPGTKAGVSGEAEGGLGAASGMLETERDRLIRTGVLTPFSSVQGFERKVTSSIPEPRRRRVLADDDDLDFAFESRVQAARRPRTAAAPSRAPHEGSRVSEVSDGSDGEGVRLQRAIARTAAQNERIYRSKGAIKVLTGSDVPKQEPIARDFRRKNQKYVKRVSEKEEGVGGRKFRRKRPVPAAEFRLKRKTGAIEVLDDGTGLNEEGVNGGFDAGVHGGPVRKRARRNGVKKDGDIRVKKEEGSEEEWSPGSDEDDSTEEDGEPAALVLPEEEPKPDVIIEGGLRIPGGTYDRLFAYQQTGVKWMWELHCQKAGGIIGDEMGLGKTVQVAAFLGALHYSGLYQPSIVVCPVTLLRQWKREVNAWYPRFKVAILHDSATQGQSTPTGNGNGFDEHPGTSEEDNESGEENPRPAKTKAVRAKRWDALIADVTNHPDGLLLTSYEQLRVQREKLLDVQWGYAILDEGHRIRNPDADITLVCKQLQTVHRIVMSGAPIQNKLTELWSLFDFVFPGKLGTLPVFQAQFALPIAIGGYANASQLQASTAYKCAVVLRDLIMPYLLRRMKADVEAQLPKKTEQVLFVSLTEEQRSVYRSFLASNEVEAIIAGDRNALYGIDIMRKICNHPDLLERDEMAAHPDYGNPERSGKLKVVAKILPLWKAQGHRVLLFCQTQQMLDIIENFVANSAFVYRRMDGNTPINQRMAIIDEFNNSEAVFVLILTTKVGGLGTNLVGANRVIIFDPDWNPSTDMQARERAWRIGQKRDVTVYRLITSGTIEEKVYHRQIYKHFLTNKILRDPRQRRFFKAKDLTDLFILGDGDSGRGTETSEIFGGGEEIVERGPNVRAQLLKGMRKARASAAGAGEQRDGPEALEGPGPSRKGKEKVTDDEEGLEGLYREDATEEKPKASGEETGLLKSLFESTGVHSTMDHDRIVGANDPENVIVDYEANRVARRAAEALRQSRVARANADVAVPTWTGRSGAAGAPDGVRRRFGGTVNTRIVQQSRVSTSPESSGGRFGGLGGGLGGGLSGGLGAGRGALSSSALLARVREGRLAAEEAHSGGTGTPSRLPGGLTGGLTPRLPGGLRSSSRESSPLASGLRPSSREGSPLRMLPAPEGDRKPTPSELRRINEASGSATKTGGLVKSTGVKERKGVGSAQPEILIRQICTFLQERGGSAPSAELVQYFADRIKPENMALFRQLLKQIATLKKSEGDGPSLWVIKSEYQ